MKASAAAAWSSMLTPASLPKFPPPRSDDPRLNEVIVSRSRRFDGDSQVGRAVLLWLSRLMKVCNGNASRAGRRCPRPGRHSRHPHRQTPVDPTSGARYSNLAAAIDLGDLRPLTTLEESCKQWHLASIVGQDSGSGSGADYILGRRSRDRPGALLGFKPVAADIRPEHRKSRRSSGCAAACRRLGNEREFFSSSDASCESSFRARQIRLSGNPTTASQPGALGILPATG